MESLNHSIDTIEHTYGLIFCRMYELKHENICFNLVRWILKALVLFFFFLSFDLISVLFNLSFCMTQFEIRN
jgi:hypothetical protein